MLVAMACIGKEAGGGGRTATHQKNKKTKHVGSTYVNNVLHSLLSRIADHATLVRNGATATRLVWPLILAGIPSKRASSTDAEQYMRINKII